MPVYPGTLQISYDFSDPTCYPGTGNTVFSLVGANTGSVGSGVAFTTENGLSFFRFNDANSNSNIVTNFNIVSNTNFSYNVWCRPNANNISVVVFSGDNGNGTGPYISYNAGYPALLKTWLFSAGFNNGTISATSFPFENDFWYMVSYTQNGTVGKLFVNGVLLGTGDATGVQLPGVSTIFSLGGNPIGGAPDYSWTGDIAIGQLYSSALSDAQILSIYQETVNTFNLIAKYDFNNPSCYPGTGNTVYDLSGNGVTLQIESGGTFITGDINYFDLQGVTRLDSNINNAIPINSSLTCNMWVRPSFINAPSSYGNWMSLGSDGAGTIPFIGASGGGTAGIYGPKTTLVSGGFGVGTVATTDPWFTDEDQWYFLSLTSGASFGTSFYINGIQIGTNATQIKNTQASMRIGAYDSTSYNGWGGVAYLSLYNSAFSSSEIIQEFNDTRADYQLPVTKLDFSDPSCFTGTGLTVTDLSGFGNDFYFSGSGYTFSNSFDGVVSYNSANTTLTRLNTTFNDFNFLKQPLSMHIWTRLDALGGLSLSQFWCANFTGGAGSPYNNLFIFANAYSSNNEITISDGNNQFGIGTSVIIGQWNLLSFVKGPDDDLDESKVYWNGSQLPFVASGAGPINLIQTQLSGQQPNNMGIGAAHTSALQGDVYNGSWTIGEFQFFNTAIGDTQVQQYYNDTYTRFFPPIPPIPIQNSFVGGRSFNKGING